MLIRDYMDRVSRYRSQILGFCILGVIVYHANLGFRSGPLSYVLNPLWEVDIFFFLTGMGAYYSLLKNDDPMAFYKRRISRIYPPYLPVILLYFVPILVLYTGKANVLTRIQEFLGNILMLGWIGGLDNQFNWYVQALMIFYLLSPPLFLLVRGFEGSGRKLAALLAFLIVSQVCFMGSGLLIAYSRSIAFALGLAAADWAVRGREFRLNIPLMLLVFVLGHGISYYTMAMPVELGMRYGLCWYPALLILPGTLWLLSLFFSLCEKVKALAWFNSFFALMGRYSLEAYLINVLVYDVRSRLRIEIDSNFEWFAIIIAICPLSILYGKLMDKVQSRKLKS